MAPLTTAPVDTLDTDLSILLYLQLISIGRVYQKQEICTLVAQNHTHIITIKQDSGLMQQIYTDFLHHAQQIVVMNRNEECMNN